MARGPTTTLAVPIPAILPDDRLGYERAQRRRALEGRPQSFGDGKKWLPLQVLDPIMSLVRGGLEFSGCFEGLARRATRFDVVEQNVYLRGLPPAFEGLRVLHLSDLHIDSYEGFGRKLIAALEDVAFDLAVITGDLRLAIKGGFEGVLEEMRPLCAVLAACRYGAFAVLGNHDCLDMVMPLESLGLSYLLNEGVCLETDGQRLHLAGVDDAHFFGTDDIDASLADIPAEDPCIFLCHSPDLIQEAAARYCDFYLCGHTHGGQLCLPGGTPLIANASVARRFCSGKWLLGGMRGYTSRGVGFSGLPFRSHCRAEIAVHRLFREKRNRDRLALEEKAEEKESEPS